MNEACPARAHRPTKWSHWRHGCRCPETRAVAAAQWHGYQQRGTGKYRGGRPRRGEEIDEIAVERACAGDQTVWLTVQERGEAVRRLSAAGVSAKEIAKRLGVAQRTVVRWRSNLRQHNVSRETSRETSDQGRTAA